MFGNISKVYNIPKGLIFWNKLGSTSDAMNSIVGYNCTVVGTPTYSAGKFYKAYTPVDNSNRIEIPHNYFNGMVEGCIEVWVLFTSIGADALLQESLNGGTQYERCYIWMVINTGYIGFANGVPVGGSPCEVTNYPFAANVWYHFAFVWNKNGMPSGNTKEIYIDGKVVSNPYTYNGWHVNKQAYNTIFLGTYGNDVSYVFTFGKMENYKIWNYAKTDFRNRFTEPFCPVTNIEQNKFNSISDKLISISKPGEYISI